MPITSIGTTLEDYIDAQLKVKGDWKERTFILSCLFENAQKIRMSDGLS